MSADLLTRLPLSPDVYLQKIDLVREMGLLVQLDMRAYRNASFLDDRILGPTTKGSWASLAQIIEHARLVRSERPVHFIFHAGHVGSTLLSRLLDETAIVLSLREPLPLRTLAEAHDVLDQTESLLSQARFDTLLRALMQVWSRGYEATEAVVIKATSSTGRVAASILSKETTSRAVYLNIRVEPYLATLLAGRNSSIDLRGHGAVRIRQLQARIRTSIAPLHTLTLGELAAMSWLVETWNEIEMSRRVAGRVMSIDFDQFLAGVEAGMRRVLEYFELPCDQNLVAALGRSPVLTRYSKAAEFEYSPQIRAQVLRESRANNSTEIGRGLEWLENLAKAENVVADILQSRSV